MSENENDKDGEIDLDFEWDDALADWEDEIDSSAEARSTPMPQTTKEQAQAPSRPLYRPPSPGETFARRAPVARPTPATGAKAPVSPKRPIGEYLPFDEDDDEEAVESTRIAVVPQDLINSLAPKTANERPTRPPPVETASSLELDDVDAPPPPAAKAAVPAPPKFITDTLDPFAVPPDDDVVASFPPARPATPPSLALDGPDEPPRPASVPPPLPRQSKPPEPPAAAKAPAIPRPVPKPPVGLGGPRVPPPPMASGAKPAIPKPSIPRPGAGIPKPAVPPPGGAKPAIPKPASRVDLPPVPRPPLGLKKDETTAVGPGAKKLMALDEPGASVNPVPPTEVKVVEPPPPALPTPIPAPPAAETKIEAPPEVVHSSSEIAIDEIVQSSSDIEEALPKKSERPAGATTQAIGALDDVLPKPPDRILDEDLDDLLGIDDAPAEPEPAPAIEAEAKAEAEEEEAVIAEEPSADEEEEAEVSAGDDEMEFETSSEETASEEEEDEDWEAIEAAEAEQAARDRGAIAARRSVRSRKPREESFPMVGDGPDVLRLRHRLLTHLASARQGGIAARLYAAAAEISEQLGETADARALYKKAIEADPTDVVALRALRRDAVSRGEWEDLAELFQQEAQLALSPRERALALTGLAEVHLARRGDAKAAERAAGRALDLDPSAVSAALLLAEARWAQGKADEAVDALAKVLDTWDDARVRAAITLEQARVSERKHEDARARELYAKAAELDPNALDAALGVARTAARGETPTASIQALVKIAEHTQGPLREAILTRASRVATFVANDARAGVDLLADVQGVLPLHARAEAAAATRDRNTELRALGAYASAAGGTDRALALVRMAEVLAAGDDLDGAEAALRDAALADGSLGTIRVVREVIARRAGDMSRLVEAVEAGGALSAAARVAQSPDALERERELLAQAGAEGTALIAVDVLALDVAGAAGDGAAVDAALRRQADRVLPAQRIGSLVALAERAIERGDLDAAEGLLGEARQLTSGDPLVLRPLGRLAARHGADGAAAVWLEEGATAGGTRGSFAACEAGRILARSGGDALGAYRRALDAGYAPAAWAIKPIAMEAGDPLTLGEAHDKLAAFAADPIDAAGHVVRSALLRADADPDAAAELLAKASALVPNDAVLASLATRLGSTAFEASKSDRAAALARSAEGAPPALARILRLTAGAALEDVGEHAAAAALYRNVAEDHPEDPIVRAALDRSEIAAGEVARVASRRFAAVKEASEDQRVLALERLADLDLHERKDPASAVLSLQSILETSPGHLPSLRALQRYFTEHKRLDDAAEAIEKIAEHVEAGPDVAAHVRLARRLRLAGPDAPGDAADDLLVRLASRTELDLWLAPRVLAAARARGNKDLERLAAKRLAALLSGAQERGSARVRAAELLLESSPDEALELLRDAVHSAPQHPSAARSLAEACEAREAWEDAAQAWETAAAANEVRTQAAELYYRAGRIWEEKANDKDRARAAYELASERDVTHGDLFDRLRGLLEQSGDRERLAELFGQRVAAGGDTPQLVELYVKQAQLYTDASDLAKAKDALRAALALQPERLDALRNLANLCLQDEDYRGAAEVLIRIARIRKEREELRWVFFTLGDIYDRHMPDPRRAEAAFQRVLKLLPQDVPAMERLAAIYERESQLQQAAEMLAELARVDVDPESNRVHRLKLAQIYEQMGDARRAEQVIEEARRNAPTDLAVLRALADFYRRQNAGNAMAMHLNRAVNDFRHALEADLGDAAAWPGLVEVLTWRGDADAASVAASAALALGIVDVEMSKLVDARGAAPGIGAVAASEQLDELLAPQQLPAPTRSVFKIAGEALEKSLPFDMSAYRAEKIGGRDTTIRPIALEVARWFQMPEPQLFVTTAAPRVCVPVYSNPVTLLIGSELVGITDDREKLFVLVRAMKIAHAQLSVVVRAQPQEVAALLGGLVSMYDANHRAPGADPAHTAEAARRLTKNLQRKGDLGPLVFEMAGRPGYEPARLAMAASEWGNRTALVASGSAPAAFAALAKLSGERELPSDPAARIAMLSRFPEAASLLTFAVSDAHFESRRRAGKR